MVIPSGNLSDEVDEVRNIVVMPDLSVVILKPKNEDQLAGAYMSQKHPDFSILAARVLALDDLNQAKAWGAPLKKSPADMVGRCRHGLGKFPGNSRRAIFLLEKVQDVNIGYIRIHSYPGLCFFWVSQDVTSHLEFNLSLDEFSPTFPWRRFPFLKCRRCNALEELPSRTCIRIPRIPSLRLAKSCTTTRISRDVPLFLGSEFFAVW